MNNNEKYKGFILIAEYPGCNRSKGDFEPFTSGQFLKYPDVWKPVYTKQYLRDMNIDSILS